MESRRDRCLLFLLLCICIPACHGASVKNITLQVLQKNIFENRNKPFCVMYKSEYGTTKLEKHFKTFHQKIKAGIEYASWKFGIFLVDKYHRLPKSAQKIDVPETVPHISCYIGYHVYDYSHKNHTSIKALKTWFEELVAKKQNHFVEATLEHLTYYVKPYSVAVVGFASAQKHLEVENLLEKAKSDWFIGHKITFLFAHHNTDHSITLRKRFGIDELPAIAFLKKSGKSDDYNVLKILRGHNLDQKSIDMVFQLMYIPAAKLNVDSFLNLTDSVNSSETPCTLILLHTTSPTLSQPALSLYWRTIYFLREWGIHMEFAVMEVTQQSIHTVTKLFPHLLRTKLPTTALYCRQEEVNTAIIPGRPSISNIVPVLESHSALQSKSGKKKSLTFPWGYTDPNQVSLLTEGPHGYLCTIYSHNDTITDPCYKEDHKKPIIIPDLKVPFGSWHDRYDTGALERNLPKVGNLSLLNKAMWHEIIDKSHAPKHPFYPGEQKWSGEVTKTSLVIFIQGGCGNCVRKMSVFEDVRRAAQFVDGGAVYLVNCSLESDLCQENKVTGFPTLVVYRGLGWMEADRCTKLDPKLQPQHVEIEYHGVLLEKYIMPWFVKIAGKAVTNMRFEPLPNPSLKEPVQLVANLVPRSSKYIYTATHRISESYYPYECFRLACETLYSQITCMARYHPKVPNKEFSDEDDLVVTQVPIVTDGISSSEPEAFLQHHTQAFIECIATSVLMYRADGFWATIMSAGKPLSETLKAEEVSNVDKFHKPHSYSFPTKRQKCEEDPGFCTDLITEFTKDHGRLPITHMTAEHFHIRESFIFHNDLPVIVALVYKENITENATFFEVLQDVAFSLYTDMVLVTVDVREYTSWSHRFIPKNYHRGLTDEVPPVHIYPRLCVIHWSDHNHAAFYPPLDLSYTVDDPFRYNASDVIKFMHKFLKDPDSLLITTEHF